MLPDGSRPQYCNSVASSHPILPDDPPPSAACDEPPPIDEYFDSLEAEHHAYLESLTQSPARSNNSCPPPSQDATPVTCWGHHGDARPRDEAMSPCESEKEWMATPDVAGAPPPSPPPPPPRVPSSSSAPLSPVDPINVDAIPSPPPSSCAAEHVLLVAKPKRKKQATLFGYNFSLDVPLASGKRMKVTGDTAAKARELPKPFQPVPFSCDTCGGSFPTLRGLQLHQQMSKRCAAVEEMKVKQNKARLLCDRKEERAAKHRRTETVSETLRHGLQSEIVADVRRRLRMEAAGIAEDETSKVDGRRANRGVSIRTQYSFRKRLAIIEDFEAFHDETGKGVSAYVQENRLGVCFNKYLSTGKAGWRHPATRAKLVQAVSETLKKAIRINHGKPKWPLAEAELYREAKAKRAKGRKVSARWIQVRARHWMAKLYPGVPFKGGQGYQRAMCRRWGFVPRRTTSFRSSTTREKLPLIQVHHKELRVMVTTPTELTPRCALPHPLPHPTPLAGFAVAMVFRIVLIRLFRMCRRSSPNSSVCPLDDACM